MPPRIIAAMNQDFVIHTSSAVICSLTSAAPTKPAVKRGGCNMGNKVFKVIRGMPDNMLFEFRAALAQDIKSRRARGREFTSLQILHSCAALESEIRAQRRSFCYYGGRGSSYAADLGFGRGSSPTEKPYPICSRE